MNRAIVVNAQSRLGTIAWKALADAGKDLRTFDPSTQEDWSQMLAVAAGEPVETLIVAPPADRPADNPEAAIATAWLGAKHALPVFSGPRAGTLLTMGFAPPPEGGCPGQDAACESIRLLTAAALHDARGAGIALRSNRLFADPKADEAGLREVIRFLTDARSRFMSGAEITLPASSPTGPARSRLDGRSILVTGATSGIGRATAVALGAAGAWVAVGGRKLDLAEETLALVRAGGGSGCVVPLDVTDADAWARATGTIRAQRGALHGLINNAGEARNRPIEDLTLADLAFLSAINVAGVRLGMDACEPLLAAAGGAVLNIASVAGIRAGPGGSAYSATKAAMIGLSRGYAADYVRKGVPVRVNSVQPGLIWSDSVADSLGEEGARSFRAMIEPKTPLGRVGTPDEVADVIAFLMSEAARPITGQAISVSGGLELGWP